MICGIYKITSPSRRIYIGQSKHIEKRFYEHKFQPKNRNLSLIQKSIKKYGYDNHQFEIVEECKDFELDNKEIFWINRLKSNYSKFPEENGLNLTDGGNFIFPKKEKIEKKEVSEETRKKMSDSQKKIWNGNNIRKEYFSSIFSGRKAPWKTHKQSKEFIERRISKIKKPIFQYDLKGTFIKEWNSAKDIEKELGFTSDYISLCCKGKISKFKNYLWKYKSSLLGNIEEQR